MSATRAIEVSNLTKTYRLGEQGHGAQLLSEVLTGAGRRLLRRQSGRSRKQWFDALDDVSFSVPAGEPLGIVGANGAGKTTLLKLISRITRPSSGRIRLNGRVGSLLEVGTGFHPELTGRENVFLNGSMLGMRRREIVGKFDDIVEFAGVERFLDTPVKRYSSGMYVRLAFSVAAHLEPEILLVDEVLAVGDVAFQRKCLGKMGDVAGAGRTVLFVSHNLGAVQQLTERSILLEDGRLVMDGPTPEVLADYMQRLSDRSGRTTSLADARRPRPDLKRELELIHAELAESTGGVFEADAPISFDLGVRANAAVPEFRLSFTVHSYEGHPVGNTFSAPIDGLRQGETATFRVTVDDLPLAPGRYYLAVATGVGDERTGHRNFDIVSDILDFEVAPLRGDDGLLAYWTVNWGSIRIRPPRVERA
jgi:lipopolysaccharide transport system ATP-binding protein